MGVLPGEGTGLWVGLRVTGTGLTPLPVRGRSWDKAALVVGLHNWRDRGADTQRFPIRAACPHPGYDQDTKENDLLLLQVGLGPAAGKAPRRGRNGGGAGKRCREGKERGEFARCRRSCARSRGGRLGDISASHPSPRDFTPGCHLPAPMRAAPARCSPSIRSLWGARPPPSPLRYWGLPLSPPPTALRCSLPTPPPVGGGLTPPPARSWRGR